MKIERKQTGSWIRKRDLVGGSAGSIEGEGKIEESKFGAKLGVPIKFQDGVQGKFGPTQDNINLLIEAWGDDTKSWIGKRFKTEMRKVQTRSGLINTPWLIPQKEGF